MAGITLENLEKYYRDPSRKERVPAVRSLNLDCRDGEFLVLLGPSGCGKTSTLRLIAGLEQADAGTIRIGGRVVNDLSPRQRNIGMAFENYALYPPLTVRDNLVFPLRARSVPDAEIERRLQFVVSTLGLAGILAKRPRELSGGEQQRVSLGRCLIRDADAFLLDEPLSHLDSELRMRMRIELKRIHHRTRQTTVYVTHDQLEAMALADRIAILRDGWLQQVGTPAEIFERPANLFVAGFVGEPPMNRIEGTLESESSCLFFRPRGSSFRIPLPDRTGRDLASAPETGLVMGIRPNRLSLGTDGGGPGLATRVRVYESLGEEGILEAEAEGCTLLLLVDPDLPLRSGESIAVRLHTDSIVWFESAGGRKIFPN